MRGVLALAETSGQLTLLPKTSPVEDARAGDFTERPPVVYRVRGRTPHAVDWLRKLQRSSFARLVWRARLQHVHVYSCGRCEGFGARVRGLGLDPYRRSVIMSGRIAGRSTLVNPSTIQSRARTVSNVPVRTSSMSRDPLVCVATERNNSSWMATEARHPAAPERPQGRLRSPASNPPATASIFAIAGPPVSCCYDPPRHVAVTSALPVPGGDDRSSADRTVQTQMASISESPTPTDQRQQSRAVPRSCSRKERCPS